MGKSFRDKGALNCRVLMEQSSVNWLFSIPKDLLLQILVEYVDPVSALSLYSVNKRSLAFFREHFVFKRIFLYSFGEPRKGRKNKKRRELMAVRQQDPIYW